MTWSDISTAPRKEWSWVLLKMADGTVCIGSWALEVPPDEFGGGVPARWESDGEGFAVEPVQWMPIPP